jgi:dTDP-4-dehydrorhamnose reductase
LSDITDDAAVSACVAAEAPDVIVNCAAYNAVDAAQDDPVTALNVNAFGVRAIARAAAVAGATLVHYSSDFVFDGQTDRPYVDDGRPGGSVAAILNTLRAGGTAKVFEDRIVSPTFVIDAARATRHVIEQGATAGLYHCVNSGRSTWLEFARELERQLGLEGRLVPVRVADMPMRAQRPQYCALSNDKLAVAGFRMPTWQDGVSQYPQTRVTRNL